MLQKAVLWYAVLLCLVGRQGVPIRAHSQILRARSEVFDRQLSSGLRESMSNEIVIEDAVNCPLRGINIHATTTQQHSMEQFYVLHLCVEGVQCNHETCTLSVVIVRYA